MENQNQVELGSTIGRTRKQRNKSGRRHLNPDFIYEDLSAGSGIRPRSSSWSSVGKAAIVERKVNSGKKTTIDKSKAKIHKNLSAFDTDEKLKDQKQRAIDQVFDKDAYAKSTNNSAQTPDVNLLIQQFDVGANGEDNDTSSCDPLQWHPEANESVNAYVTQPSDKFLREYGSEIDTLSLKDQSSVADINPGDEGIGAFSKMAENIQTQTYEEAWRELLEDMRGEMKTELSKAIEEVSNNLKETWKTEVKEVLKNEMITEMKIDMNKVLADLNVVKTQYKTCQL